jgi:hypothetical protein
MECSSLSAWKADAQRLIVVLRADRLSAYVAGLAHLWDNRELTVQERRKLPTMLRRELLMDASPSPPDRMAKEALARVYQNFQIMRSAERIFVHTEVEHDDAA